MKSDAYMRFYGAVFLNVVRGRPRAAKWGYLVASWYYWAEKCEGLDDDDDFLRELCECSEDEWPKVRAIMFDKSEGSTSWFKLVGNRWHCLFLQDLYADTQRRLQAFSRAGKAGMLKRWSNRPPPPKK